MNKMTILYIFAALFAVVSTVLHIFLGEKTSVILSGDIDAVVVAALPVVTSVYTASYFERGSTERKVWFTLMGGLLFWLLGETLWLYYEGVAGVAPEASLADGAWLFGYLFILAAFVAQYRLLKVRLGRKYELGIGVAVFLAAMATSLLTGWVTTGDGDLTRLERAVYVAYMVGDFLLLYWALLMAGLYWGGKLSFAWLLVAVGVSFYSAGDVWFAYLEWQDLYLTLTWNPVDATWLLGDLLVFLGAAKYRLSLEEVG